MSVEGLIEYVLDHVDQGLIEYADHHGLLSVVREWPEDVRLRVVLQHLRQPADVAGVLLISRLAREPDMRAVTALTPDGWERTWVAARHDGHLILGAWEQFGAALGLPHPTLDLAAVHRYVTGEAHVHTHHPCPDVVGLAVAAGMQEYVASVGQLLDAVSAKIAAEPEREAAHEDLMRMLALFDAQCAAHIHNHMVRCAHAIRGPRIVSDEPLPEGASEIWERVRRVVPAMEALPWSALDPSELAKNLELPEGINAEWWGAEAILGMKLLVTPVSAESIVELQDRNATLAHIAVDRLRSLFPSEEAFLHLVGGQWRSVGGTES